MGYHLALISRFCLAFILLKNIPALALLLFVILIRLLRSHLPPLGEGYFKADFFVSPVEITLIKQVLSII